ncbi:unnamed protein product [Leuciscus chuanchicus]
MCESLQQERRPKSGSGVCRDHKEELKLFCLDDQQLVCLVCRDSRKHTNHRFCPVDEAVADHKEILRASLEDLQEELRNDLNCEQNLYETAEDTKFHAQCIETLIKEVFEELHQFLHDEEASRITVLREEEEKMSQRMKKKIEETSKQISSLTITIRDIEEQMKAEDVSFLQNFEATLQRFVSIPTLTLVFCNLRSRFLLRSILDFFDDEDSLSCDSAYVWSSIINNRAVQPFKLAGAVTSASHCSAPPLLLTSDIFMNKNIDFKQILKVFHSVCPLESLQIARSMRETYDTIVKTIPIHTDLQNRLKTLAQYIPDPDLGKSVTIAFTNHLTNLKLNVLQKMKDNIGTTSASASEFSINCSHSLSHLFSDDSYDAYELM